MNNDDYDELEEFDEYEKDRSARAERRRAERKKKRQAKAITEYSGYPGPYFSDDKDRVINPGRGKRSKEIKKQCNKKVRHSELGTNPSDYRKAADYWWELC